MNGRTEIPTIEASRSTRKAFWVVITVTILALVLSNLANLSDSSRSEKGGFGVCKVVGRDEPGGVMAIYVEIRNYDNEPFAFPETILIHRNAFGVGDLNSRGWVANLDAGPRTIAPKSSSGERVYRYVPPYDCRWVGNLSYIEFDGYQYDIN